MILYSDNAYLSPYAMSVFVALTEKALPFELRALNLGAGEHQQTGFAQTSLTRRVPTLVDGDFALAESTAITEYLDEAYPGVALYPKDLRQRAQARQVQAWIRSDLMPVRSERSTEVVFLHKAVAPLTEAGHAAADKLVNAASALVSGGDANLFGDWCLADTDLALMLLRLINANDPVPDKLRAYALRQWARPTVQAWVALGQK